MARRKLTAKPETITSIGMRGWTRVGQPQDLWYKPHTCKGLVHHAVDHRVSDRIA
jgi:hypothetical protein